MPWRKHQSEVISICNEIIDGKPIDTVYIDAHPGSGKSGDSILFAKHLIGNGFDKIMHVAPRLSLVYQIEEGMLDPFFDSGKTIRVADNGPDPSRGLDGFGITFQAIASNDENIIEDFKKHNYILVADEHHHCSFDGTWNRPFIELVKLSKLCVFMTGTAFRHTGDKISFFPYKNNKLDKTETDYIRWVTYTREDALREDAIIPVKLNLIDGSGEYRKGDKLIEYSSMEREHLNAAVRSDYAIQVIDIAMSEFMEYRRDNPWAQMIIVGADIELARSYSRHVNHKWCECKSVDSQMKDSLETIKSYRHGDFPVLSSCNQASEGLDVPNTAFMIILHVFRSEPWLIQCLNRATRFKSFKDFAYITAPSDPDFVSFFKNLIWEQERALEYKEKKDGVGSGMGGSKPELEIISGNAHITPSAKEKIFREEINNMINSYIGEKSVKTLDGKKRVVHTESMRRRKILFYKIYVAIGRSCKLKEMNMNEMEIARDLILSLTTI